MTDYQRDDYPQHLTLEWLKEKNLPIYVRNITRPRGQLTLNMPVEGGKIKGAKIHRTHLPIELSAKFSKESIIRCDDLRKCIVSEVVELVRPDHAIKELKEEGAFEEIKNLEISEFSARQGFTSPRVKEMETVQNRPAGGTSINELGVETHVIQPRVLSLVQKLTNGDISIKAAVSELKTMADELKETDCSYILSNGPEGQVQTFAKKQLAQVRAKAIETHDVQDDEMSAEETASEMRREAIARQHQKV